MILGILARFKLAQGLHTRAARADEHRARLYAASAAAARDAARHAVGKTKQHRQHGEEHGVEHRKAERQIDQIQHDRRELQHRDGHSRQQDVQQLVHAGKLPEAAVKLEGDEDQHRQHGEPRRIAQQRVEEHALAQQRIAEVKARQQRHKCRELDDNQIHKRQKDHTKRPLRVIRMKNSCFFHLSLTSFLWNL